MRRRERRERARQLDVGLQAVNEQLIDAVQNIDRARYDIARSRCISAIAAIEGRSEDEIAARFIP
jgi:hypothetical protein